MAAPAFAWTTAGAAALYTAYNVSNIIEGAGNVYYGSHGDVWTQAYNPGRDSVFGGNQEAWDTFGTACAITMSVASAGVGFMGAGAAGAASATSSIGRSMLAHGLRVGMNIGGAYVGGELGTAVWCTLNLDEDWAWLGGLAGMLLGAKLGDVGYRYLDHTYNISGLHPKTTTFEHKGKKLKDVDVKELKYKKCDRAEYKAKLAEASSAKSKFVKWLAQNKLAELKSAGFSDSDIAKMLNGKWPEGYQVHHVVPLDDGGTNDLDNFVLIDSGSHAIVTGYQNAFCKSIPIGGYQIVEWPYFMNPIYVP